MCSILYDFIGCFVGSPGACGNKGRMALDCESCSEPNLK